MNGGHELKSILSVKETAEIFGVHPNTIGNWVKDGTIVSSRVAGARAHRFTRQEVSRLLRERGKTTASVAPALRTDGPELVTANELNEWAAHDDAKVAFPELVRRLLALTPGVSNIDIRTHEGNAAPGWDGTATSAGTSFLPGGELRMEFGTDQKIRQKAQSDWDKRVGALPANEEATFVFATPRNWAGHKAWAAERASEAKFSDVKAIDAHVLEGWLQSTPSVHYWISERLGYRPRDAQSLERWWSSFNGRTGKDLPSKFFLSGRALQVRELREAITNSQGSAITNSQGSAGVVTVQAAWADEALAFVYAALVDEPKLMARTVVVTDISAWHRLVESASQLILIPRFDDEVQWSIAAEKGHRVVLIADPAALVRNGGKILLPKVERGAAREALGPLFSDRTEVERLVALARRSTAAFIRSLAQNSVLPPPVWLTDSKQSAVLAPLVFLGAWTTGDGDVAIVERITRHSYDDVDSLLSSLATRPDAPFVRSGGVWLLTAPVEAALLLLPRLTKGDRTQWETTVKEVLLEPDPFVGMSQTARMMATANGDGWRFSRTLKKGIAQGLALAAANSVVIQSTPTMDDLVRRIVRGLLSEANDDDSGKTWDSLAYYLPLFAEAAPDIFIDAVSLDLERQDPIVRTLFRDSGPDMMFGPSSPHPSLIWALENLCWSREYFGQSAELLGRLAAVDPGGRLGNRPIESLQAIEMGWAANSAATVKEKIVVLERLLRRDADLGWNLAVSLWPNEHAYAMSPHTPEYRDWTPTQRAITWGDWGYFVHNVVSLTLVAASNRPDRWCELVPKIDELPPKERALVFQSLADVVRDGDWSVDDRHVVWLATVDEADKHEEYSDADWAMGFEDVARLREIAENLKPGPDPRRFARLFDWRIKVPGLKLGDPGFHEKVERLRIEAVDEVLASGPNALTSLVLEAKAPHTVGVLAAHVEAPESEILGWLSTDEPNLRQAASAFVQVKIIDTGFEWAASKLSGSELSSSTARDLFMKALPLRESFWSEVEGLPPELQAAYWSAPNAHQVPAAERVPAIRLLLEHGRQWAALDLLSALIQDGEEPSISLIKSVLDSMLKGLEPRRGDSAMDSYYVGNVLQAMEDRVPDDSDLPRYEFMFFELLRDHKPSRALYRLLGTNPNEFVDMMKAIYRSDDEPTRSLTPNEQAFAHLSWSVIHEWNTLPGLAEDGAIDSEHLKNWVRKVRLLLEESGRSAIGDEQVGQVLSTSPIDGDGVWPAEPVRDLIDDLGSKRIDTGVHIGKMNQRGVTSRGVFDGGDQERELETRYREWAIALATKWPRTARVLRGIADDYQRDAREQDAEAERRGDDG